MANFLYLHVFSCMHDPYFLLLPFFFLHHTQKIVHPSIKKLSSTGSFLLDLLDLCSKQEKKSFKKDFCMILFPLQYV